MAEYRILYWGDIPYGVRAWDENGRVTRQLPRQFEAAIDALAMAVGATEEAEYRAGFRWGDTEERPGAATEVAEAVVEELITAYPQERLAEVIRQAKAEGG